MLRRGIPNISYYLIDDICGFLVNKRTKLLLGDLNLAKMVEEVEAQEEWKQKWKMKKMKKWKRREWIWR